MYLMLYKEYFHQCKASSACDSFNSVTTAFELKYLYANGTDTTNAHLIMSAVYD